MIQSFLTSKVHVVKHSLLTVQANCDWFKIACKRCIASKEVAYSGPTLFYCKQRVDFRYTNW